MARAFDATRAWLRGPDHFPRFEVRAPATPVEATELGDDEVIVVARRHDEAVGFRKREIAYHHLAQGTLAGEPYLVSF